MATEYARYPHSAIGAWFKLIRQFEFQIALMPEIRKIQLAHLFRIIINQE